MRAGRVSGSHPHPVGKNPRGLCYSEFSQRDLKFAFSSSAAVGAPQGSCFLSHSFNSFRIFLSFSFALYE